MKMERGPIQEFVYRNRKKLFPIVLGILGVLTGVGIAQVDLSPSEQDSTTPQLPETSIYQIYLELLFKDTDGR